MICLFRAHQIIFMSTVKTDVQDITETRKTITVSVAAAEIASIEAKLISGVGIVHGVTDHA